MGELRPSLKEEKPGASFGELGKAAGERWRARQAKSAGGVSEEPAAGFFFFFALPPAAVSKAGLRQQQQSQAETDCPKDAG